MDILALLVDKLW